MTQGPALLQIMENPDDLRVAIDCLERATALLASIEQCRYPEQVRTHSKAKRPSSATTVMSSAPALVLDPAERLRARILSFIGRHWEKEHAAQLCERYAIRIERFRLTISLK